MTQTDASTHLRLARTVSATQKQVKAAREASRPWIVALSRSTGASLRTARRQQSAHIYTAQTGPRDVIALSLTELNHSSQARPGVAHVIAPRNQKMATSQLKQLEEPGTSNPIPTDQVAGHRAKRSTTASLWTTRPVSATMVPSARAQAVDRDGSVVEAAATQRGFPDATLVCLIRAERLPDIRPGCHR